VNEEGYLEDLVVDGSTILKLILKRRGPNSSVSGYGDM
jgi:hypothetical protein